MELRDFIARDEDRLFVLDFESFIIFTGDAPDDDKPFIRIGNWINLPVEIIPLIENIIITDRIMGDPAIEQFNIDINYLQRNRYIGSRNIVKRYLDFQKSFGLDLTNASIVDIEKDIPEITSKEKIISDRDSYIGIFYRDGNFRVTHRGTTLFNLAEIEEKHHTDSRIHGLLSKQNGRTPRYEGAGMVLLKNNPLFYKNRYFTSYHFPRHYYADFERLNIDPACVREALLPSSNMMNITRLAKWKHQSGGRLRIFTDYRESAELLQRLLSATTVPRQNFSGVEYDTGEGLGVRNYNGTFNVSLTYRRCRPSAQDLTLAYIKGTRGVREIVREKLDGILVSYPVYAEMNLHFKSVACPVAVVASDMRATARLRGVPVIVPGVQYEFFKHENPAAVFRDLDSGAGGLYDDISEEDLDALRKWASSAPRITVDSSPEECVEHLRAIAALRAGFMSTSDRKYASSLKKTIDDLEGRIDRHAIYRHHSGRMRVCFAFCGEAIIEYAEMFEAPAAEPSAGMPDEILEDAAEMPPDRRLRELHARILRDRRRLMELLRIFSREAGREDLEALKGAITRKKDEYHAEVHFETPAAQAPGADGGTVPSAVRPMTGRGAAAGQYGAPDDETSLFNLTKQKLSTLASAMTGGRTDSAGRTADGLFTERASIPGRIKSMLGGKSSSGPAGATDRTGRAAEDRDRGSLPLVGRMKGLFGVGAADRATGLPDGSERAAGVAREDYGPGSLAERMKNLTGFGAAKKTPGAPGTKGRTAEDYGRTAGGSPGGPVAKIRNFLGIGRAERGAGMTEGAPGTAGSLAAPPRIRNVLPALVIILAAGALAWFAWQGIHTRVQEKKAVEAKREAERAAIREAERQKRIQEEMIQRYGIKVPDTEIFAYVNRVAVLNGYAPIPFVAAKTRNPNWIWPGNVFMMPDGERIMVREGDTLWGIVHRKLLGNYLMFYGALDELKKGIAEGRNVDALRRQAEKLAVTGKERRDLEGVIKTIPGKQAR